MQVLSPRSFFSDLPRGVVSVPRPVRPPLRMDLTVCVHSFCQFFSMGVSSVFTLLLCGNTTFTLAVAFVSATMGLTTFSHRYRHPVCHRTIRLFLSLSLPKGVFQGSVLAPRRHLMENWLTRRDAVSKPRRLVSAAFGDDGH